MTIVVNVSDMRVSIDPAAVLATYSLGSCIGVCAYDATAKVGGMLHFQLPSSALDPERARQRPLMFADSGMEKLLGSMEAHGANRHRLRIRLAGAAQMLGDASLFNIGRRNHAAIRKVLWQQGIFVDAEAIGGTSPRNMYLNVNDGAVTISTQGNVVAL